MQSGPLKTRDLQMPPGTFLEASFSSQPLRNYKAFSGETEKHKMKAKLSTHRETGQKSPGHPAALPSQPALAHPNTQNLLRHVPHHGAGRERGSAEPCCVSQLPLPQPLTPHGRQRAELRVGLLGMALYASYTKQAPMRFFQIPPPSPKYHFSMHPAKRQNDGFRGRGAIAAMGFLD